MINREVSFNARVFSIQDAITARVHCSSLRHVKARQKFHSVVVASSNAVATMKDPYISGHT